MKIQAAFFIAALFFGIAVHAQEDHAQHAPDHAANLFKSPSIQSFQQSSAKMHKDMNISYTGDTDSDFVRGMIPHHQGAVDMARIVLQYGKDPEIRKLAQDIIASQEKEIAFMQSWLQKQKTMKPKVQ